MTDSEKARSQARATILKALAHPTRMFIVDKLSEGPHCVSELTRMVGADTSTVSKHLSILKHAGILSDRKEGTTVYYSLEAPCLLRFINCVEEVIQHNISRQLAGLRPQ